MSAADEVRRLNDDDTLVPPIWYGFVTPEGWAEIVLALHTRIRTKYPDYNVYQVKQKFGSLRYYCSVRGDDEVNQWISEAVEQAAKTCEVCSGPAELRKQQGWWSTLCDEHAKGE